MTNNRTDNDIVLRRREALQRLMSSEDITITADQASEVLNMSAQAIRDQAQVEPGKLGFRCIVCGKRVEIPRRPFIEYLTGGITA